MATLNLEPAISTRYRIERVMYRGRSTKVDVISKRARTLLYSQFRARD